MGCPIRVDFPGSWSPLWPEKVHRSSVNFYRRNSPSCGSFSRTGPSLDLEELPTTKATWPRVFPPASFLGMEWKGERLQTVRRWMVQDVLRPHPATLSSKEAADPGNLSRTISSTYFPLKDYFKLSFINRHDLEDGFKARSPQIFSSYWRTATLL